MQFASQLYEKEATEDRTLTLLSFTFSQNGIGDLTWESQDSEGFQNEAYMPKIPVMAKGSSVVTTY